MALIREFREGRELAENQAMEFRFPPGGRVMSKILFRQGCHLRLSYGGQDGGQALWMA